MNTFVGNLNRVLDNSYNSSNGTVVIRNLYSTEIVEWLTEFLTDFAPALYPDAKYHLSHYEGVIDGANVMVSCFPMCRIPIDDEGKPTIEKYQYFGELLLILTNDIVRLQAEGLVVCPFDIVVPSGIGTDPNDLTKFVYTLCRRAVFRPEKSE